MSLPRKGSVLVDFNLEHEQYGGSRLDSKDIEAVLEDQLDQGQLGSFRASMHKFKFSQVKEGRLVLNEICSKSFFLACYIDTDK